MTAPVGSRHGLRCTLRPASAASSWQPRFWVGGVSGLVFVGLALVPMVLLFVAPVPPADAAELLGYVAEHRAAYLIELVCFVGLSVPPNARLRGGPRATHAGDGRVHPVPAATFDRQFAASCRAQSLSANRGSSPTMTAPGCRGIGPSPARASPVWWDP